MIQEPPFEDYFRDNWKDVVDKMKEGLMLVDPSGRILYVNRALEDIFQYKREELLGNLCDTLECSKCIEHRNTKGEKGCDLFKTGTVRDLRCTFKRKDGTPVTVLKNATILTNADNRVVAGVETLTDLTAIVSRDQEITDLRRHLNREDGFQGIIGNDPSMNTVYELIRSAAESNAPVVIYGESGTGKELVAGAIHHLSSRKSSPLIKVNCAALNENLLESELFGHIRGAFTGADKARLGRFEAADQGSIFLDEIGDLPISTQTKLLRVLQEQEIERVGDHQPIPINVRVISATNKDLDKLMREEKFRDDLYYRIGVIPIIIPPLRQRKDDIPLLVKTFIERERLKTKKEIPGITKKALELLCNYQWPGNVRELMNVIEYSFVICQKSKIEPSHLPTHLTTDSPRADLVLTPGSSKSDSQMQIMEAIKQTGGNRSKAAKLLGISRVTLWKRLKKYNITIDKSST
ncbi:MAG: sigma 54-interacting transcriptional regulator [Thermodesulfobacteriota bacterium]